MGWIAFPEYVENCYLNTLGREWVTEEVFAEEFERDYPNQLKNFLQYDKTSFILFFTTAIKGQQPKDWEQLMMVVGETNNSKKYGKYIRVKAIYRYGFAFKKIYTLNDVIEELEEYFPEGISHVDTALDGRVYYTYVGWVNNFPDLLTEVKYTLKGWKQ